jgi:hypothetical protein
MPRLFHDYGRAVKVMVTDEGRVLFADQATDYEWEELIEE